MISKWMAGLAIAGLGAAPALAGEHGSGWVRKIDDRPYVFFVPGDYGRSGRFVSWDDGYFARGGGVEVAEGQVRFDYDRSYPYEFYYLEAEPDEAPVMDRPSFCETKTVRDGRRGRSPVRVCRN